MSNDTLRIVGINPGTRYVGLAAFHGYDLRDWRVKGFKGTWSKGKSVAILAAVREYLDRFTPDLVAVKRLHPARSSRQLEALTDAMVNEAAARGLQVRRYSIAEMACACLPAGRRGRKALASRLAEIHPELEREGRREAESRNPYHRRMFEAVALASTCLRQLKAKKKKYVECKREGPSH